ncbi:hypothetical protein ACTXT7_003709 [Hymenolepis weldensis]
MSIKTKAIHIDGPAIEWHITHRNPTLCHRGLLLLQSKCLTTNITMNDYNVEAEFQDLSSMFGTNCHNLIDICLGPVDFYSDVAIYENEELAHVARLVEEVFNPNPVLKYVNDSMESLTMETIQGIKDLRFMASASLNRINK